MIQVCDSCGCVLAADDQGQRTVESSLCVDCCRKLVDRMREYRRERERRAAEVTAVYPRECVPLGHPPRQPPPTPPETLA